LGIITVLIFGDYYVAFWGLLLSSISGIIQATRPYLYDLIFQMTVDDSSSANESSSEHVNPNISNRSKHRGTKHSKRPPPPSSGAIIKSTSSSPIKTTTTTTTNDNNTTGTEAAELAESEIINNLGLVNCSECGKQFGKVSIKFHLPQCQKKQQLIKERQAAEEKKNISSYNRIEEAEGLFVCLF
jgi:endogenous inhibitor of DNA gyrase (YacG/DUF329 family)